MNDKPIDMVLHCPVCGRQHVDAVEFRCPKCDSPDPARHPAVQFEGEVQVCDHIWHKEPWDNPPHRSHKCHGCGTIWRPADVPTNGVKRVTTRGKADTWPADGEKFYPADVAMLGGDPSL